MSSTRTVCGNLSLIAIDDAQRIGRDHGHLVIGQVDDLVGVPGQRRGVAGHEVLAVADAHHQRAAQPRGDDHVGIIAKQDRQAIGALQLRQRLAHRLDQRAMPRSDRRRKPFASGSVASAAARANCSSRQLAIRWAITSLSVAERKQ